MLRDGQAKRHPKASNAEFITSAMAYKFVGNARIRVVRKIEECM